MSEWRGAPAPAMGGVQVAFQLVEAIILDGDDKQNRCHMFGTEHITYKVLFSCSYFQSGSGLP